MEDIVAIVVFGIVASIPLAGLTARFALKPVVEAFVRLRESGPTGSGVRAEALTERRVAVLEAEVEALRATVARLEEESEFQSRLRSPTADALPRPRR